jgi:hypothetical protein
MGHTQYTGFLLRYPEGRPLLLLATRLFPVSPLMAFAGRHAPAQDASDNLNAAGRASAILTHRSKSGMFEY